MNRKKIILKIIEENDGIGINKLHKILDKDPKISMAKNTMIKLVYELENEGKIRVIHQKGTQSVKLTTKIKKVKLEQKTARQLEKIVKECERRLDRLKKLQDMDDTDMGVLVNYFIKLVSFYDWKFYSTSKEYDDVRLNQLIKRFETLKNNLYLMIRNKQNLNDEIIQIIDERLNSTISDYEYDFDADLESFESDIQ